MKTKPRPIRERCDQVPTFIRYKQHQKLKAASAATGMTIIWMLTSAIEAYLENLEIDTKEAE
jgi:predicted DNA-binding protein